MDIRCVSSKKNGLCLRNKHPLNISKKQQNARTKVEKASGGAHLFSEMANKLVILVSLGFYIITTIGPSPQFWES